MKVHLLHPNRDVDMTAAPPVNAEELTEDLQLDAVIEAMAGDDRFLSETARHLVLRPLTDLDQLTYRQDVLRDTLAHPQVVRDLYGLAVEAVTSDERRPYLGLGRSPSSLLSGSVGVLRFFVQVLHRLRRIVDNHAGDVRSEGLQRLFTTVRDDIDDTYLAEVDTHLRRLELPDGVRFGARLGTGLKPVRFVLHEPVTSRGWIRRLLPTAADGLTLEISPRDDAGTRALDDLRDRALGGTARAVAQATEHVEHFFLLLRRELAFYVACLNLHDRLTASGAPTCIPELAPTTDRALTARDLYDVGLRLRTDDPVVGNDVAADGMRLVVITGANQGGKSTFLRAVGLAQLMLQCGLFTPAAHLRASPSSALFTHFVREEDTAMRSGKLDEELSRLSRIADLVTPGSTILLNESLSSTNEREGSAIAHDVVRAFVDGGMRVVYVTHLFELADRLHDDGSATTLFLRAERADDGTRSFKVVAGRPQATSYGLDLYQTVFDDDVSDGSRVRPG